MFKQIITILLGCILVVSCTEEQNPYKDTAKIDLSLTSPSDETLKIFSSFTVSANVLLPGEISEIRVGVPNSRSWSGNDTVLTAKAFEGGAFSLPVSVSDTGTHDISLKVITRAGDTIQRTHTRRWVSPLAQPEVSGEPGETVRLQTPPVDDEVVYVWSFGPGLRVTSSSPIDSIVLASTFSSEGTLHVQSGNAQSPVFPFKIILVDKQAPVIRCLNSGLTEDTIRTTIPSLAFRVEITDNIGPIVSAKINGETFQEIDSTDKAKLLCTEPFTSLPAGETVTLIVRARDAHQRTAVDTFYIQYSSTDSSPKARIVVTSPSQDSITSTDSAISISGIIEHNITDDSLILFTSVNSQPSQNSLVLTGSLPVWERTFSLTEGLNTVEFGIKLSAGDTLDSDTVLVYYPGQAPDTTAPDIVNVIINGIPFYDSAIIIRSESASFSIFAYDHEAGVESVTINGTQAVSEGAVFSALMPVQHSKQPQTFSIEATDRDGNVGYDTARIIRNAPPEFLSLPKKSSVIADSLYLDSVKVRDSDGDELSVTARVVSASQDTTFPLDSSGEIAWWSRPADTADAAHITIVASDGIETRDTSITVIVLPASAPEIDSVFFVTSNTDFPDSLRVGRDTLSVTFRVMKEPSTRVLFKTVLQSSEKVLLSQSYDSVLTWVPTSADTGKQTLLVTLTTGQGITDTLRPHVDVLPQLIPPAVYLEYDTLQKAESLSPCSIAVVLSRPWIDTIRITTSVDPAKTTADNSDYAVIDSIALFKPGDTLSYIHFTITNDEIVEPNESIVFEMKNTGVADPASPTVSTYVIENDDDPPTPVISFTNQYVSVTEQDTQVIANLQISHTRDTDLEVHLRASGTAESGADYLFSDSIVVISSGSSEVSVTLDILDDNACEKQAEDIALEIISAEDVLLGNQTTFTVSIGPSDLAACGVSVAFVYQKSLSSTDQNMIDTVKAMGYTVDAMEQSAARAFDVYDLIILAESADEAFASGLHTVPVPVLASSREALVGLGMAEAFDAGNHNSQYLTIDGTLHQVVSQRVLFTWIRPGKGANSFAATYDASQITGCVYPSGSVLKDLTVAKARRIQFPVGSARGRVDSLRYLPVWWEKFKAVVAEAVASQ